MIRLACLVCAYPDVCALPVLLCPPKSFTDCQKYNGPSITCSAWFYQFHPLCLLQHWQQMSIFLIFLAILTLNCDHPNNQRSVVFCQTNSTSFAFYHGIDSHMGLQSIFKVFSEHLFLWLFEKPSLVYVWCVRLLIWEIIECRKRKSARESGKFWKI